jgi:sugar lactone lactonase YvrE
VSTEFPGRTFYGITTSGSDGKLYYTFDAPTQGGIGSMGPDTIGTPPSDTVVDLAPGHYGTAIVTCPDNNQYFIDVDSSDSSTMIGSLVAGSVSTFPAPGAMTVLTCGPNDDLYYGTTDGKVYHVPLATFTAALAIDLGGAIGGITLGPDGAIWATDTPQNRLYRIIP